jgi:hypothetical protein
MEYLVKDVDGHTDCWVRDGFCERGDMIRLVAQGVADEFHEFEQPEEVIKDTVAWLMPLVERRVDAALATRAIEESSWPTLTECDRLNAAFADLEAQGVLARQQFMCCYNCGHRCLGEEAERQRKEGVNVRGYVFYDAQSADDAKEGQGVWLHYYCAWGAGSSTRSIGREIVAVLRSHGLHPIWSGSASKSIEVPIQWQRRVATLPFGVRKYPEIPDSLARVS